MLGKTYRRLGEREPARESLARARRLKPGRPYIELESANVLAAEGEVEEARRCLRRVRGVRGWQAWKAARVALSLGEVEAAKRWLATAARDREVATSPKYDEVKAALDAAISEQPTPKAAEIDSDEHVAGARHLGKVHHVRADRGFGFLVDEADGARCYFKLVDTGELSAKDAVEFIRADTERGPAARDVRLRPAA